MVVIQRRFANLYGVIGSCNFLCQLQKDTLRVVDHYKYLGSVVCLSETLIYDAQHKCSSALCSYPSLAGRVFGSRCIPSKLKTHLLLALVQSRLLYGTQLWGGNMTIAMRKLNAVYTRGLREIINDCRYGRCKLTDFRVREQLVQPSIDCLLLRRRLAFLGRIVTTSHRTVIAVLSMTARNEPLPWVERITQDMLTLWKSWPEGHKQLPCPIDHPVQWWQFMLDHPERWKQMVAAIFFVHSILDDKVEAMVAGPQFVCTICVNSNFASRQALLQHMRRNHN